MRRLGARGHTPAPRYVAGAAPDALGTGSREISLGLGAPGMARRVHAVLIYCNDATSLAFRQGVEALARGGPGSVWLVQLETKQVLLLATPASTLLVSEQVSRARCGGLREYR